MYNELVNELAVAPLGDLIASIGKGVGEAQAALDAGSLSQTLELYRTPVPGENVNMLSKMMKEIGYRPTFYVLPETEVDVRVTMAISNEATSSQNIETKKPDDLSLESKLASLKPKLTKSSTYVSTLNASTANKYNMDYQMATNIKFKIVPIPPPVFVENLIETDGVQDFIDKMSKSSEAEETDEESGKQVDKPPAPTIITVTDVFTPNPTRSKNMQAQDAVMQLKNEIVKSGALKMEKVENNRIRVSLKLAI